MPRRTHVPDDPADGRPRGAFGVRHAPSGRMILRVVPRSSPVGPPRAQGRDATRESRLEYARPELAEHRAGGRPIDACGSREVGEGAGGGRRRRGSELGEGGCPLGRLPGAGRTGEQVGPQRASGDAQAVRASKGGRPRARFAGRALSSAGTAEFRPRVPHPRAARRASGRRLAAMPRVAPRARSPRGPQARRVGGLSATPRGPAPSSPAVPRAVSRLFQGIKPRQPTTFAPIGPTYAATASRRRRMVERTVTEAAVLYT